MSKRAHNSILNSRTVILDVKAEAKMTEVKNQSDLLSIEQCELSKAKKLIHFKIPENLYDILKDQTYLPLTIDDLQNCPRFTMDGKVIQAKISEGPTNLWICPELNQALSKEVTMEVKLSQVPLCFGLSDLTNPAVEMNP
ncbi:hypothetical protein GJ496_006827 [Pomphorhynchus laevis]|nr:hypothetical protein GJ496_006827 [Pomphorhynchus laevis]